MIRRPFTLLSVALVEVSLLAIALGCSLALDYPLPRMPTSGMTYVVLLVGLLPSLFFIPWSMRSSWPMAVQLREDAFALWDSGFSGATQIDMAIVALFAGFCEETAFRGVLQPILVEQIGMAGGVFVTALLFGLLHPTSRAYVALATVIGAWLGFITWYMGDCVSAIMIHAVHDWMALMALEKAVRLR